MSPPLSEKSLHWTDEDATADFARDLASRPALLEATIALRGVLGAGKTTLVRHLLRALGVTGRIKSPTYAVVEPYTVGPGGGAHDHPVYHFDFYRFTDPREWEDAGFREVFAGPGLKLCEWPDQAAGLMPVADLEVTLELLDDDSRAVRLQAHTPRGESLLS